jgi:hypothetical protein
MVESRGNPAKIETKRLVETVQQGWKGHRLQTSWYARPKKTSWFLSRGQRNLETYPIVDPPAQPMDKNENACAILVSSVSSPRRLFTMPTFPLRAPAIALLMTSAQNVLERPKPIMDSTRPKTPIKITGFLPILSDRRPHWRIVRD